ncbi:MAG: amino acid ABC transporter permease [Clostridia bacterium]|nr:amino acid ABC transporter permease [Clostridia bacterium]
MEGFWTVMRDNFGELFMRGLIVTLPLTVASFSLGLVIAMFTAMVQFANVDYLKQAARFYIWIIRGTPLLVQLYVLFYLLPSIGILLPPGPTAVLALSLNEGAYCAETIRASLEAVPAGQIEAGYCVGMSYGQIMRRVVVPQAMRTAFPPLGNSLISMLKDTSLVANITVVEMMMVAKKAMSVNFKTLAMYIDVAIIYLLFSTALSMLQRFGEKKLNQRGVKRA